MCILLFAFSGFFLCSFPSVLWYSWLGLPYDLYCVGGDEKHCSINRSYITLA